MRSWVFREILELGRERLAGRLTQAELESAVKNLVAPEIELPLGIGGATEAPRGTGRGKDGR